MNTLNRLMEINSRIEHMENAAEWIARETVHSDNSISQTGTLICALADELRERVCDLVKQVEFMMEEGPFH